MPHFTAKQKRQVIKTIRLYKNRQFPDRGGGKRLADAIGVSPQLLSNWLHGTRFPSPVHMMELARVFGISLAEFCTLPQSKRKMTACDVICRLTKLRENSTLKGITASEQQRRLHDINHIVTNILEDLGMV